MPGYIQLLKRNPDVRNLWLAQTISQLGDWFNSVALLGLIVSLSGNPLATSLTVVFQMLPAALTGVFLGGYVADRFDRKKVMIIADLARAVIALSFLFIRTPEWLWIAYAGTLMLLIRTPEWLWIAYAGTLMLSVGGAFFDPATAAALPNLCQPGELQTANALQQSTWASSVFVGAALGGVVAQAFGRDASFIANSASFALSALFLSQISGRFNLSDGRQALSSTGAARALTDGFRFLMGHRRVLLLSLTKAIWALTLGGIGLYSVYAFNRYHAGDIGTSWLYAGRGLGAFVGPLIATSLFAPHSLRDYARTMLGAFFFCALGYAVFAVSDSAWVGALGLAVAHLGGGSVWAFSRMAVQRETPDQLRGRVLAVDGMTFSVTTSLSTVVVGAVASASGETLGVLSGVAATVIATGLWLLAMRSEIRRAAAAEPRSL